MTPRWRSALTGSEVHEADARLVAQTLPAGSVTCSILDGPYGMGKAEWDRVPRRGTLGDLYTGHLDDVGRLSAPSASLYLWNTSAGWAELHPLILARGWTFRSLIVWDKVNPVSLIGWRSASAWCESTEVCGFYTRGAPHFALTEPIGTVWHLSITALNTNTDEVLRLATLKQDRLRKDMMIKNALHPCQKPLLFAERMIKASSRPGDTVWVPFGGTLREMVAAERMARGKPGEARRVISCELNADGVDYIGPAVAQAQGLPTQTTGQADLFGGTP